MGHWEKGKNKEGVSGYKGFKDLVPVSGISPYLQEGLTGELVVGTRLIICILLGKLEASSSQEQR